MKRILVWIIALLLMKTVLGVGIGIAPQQSINIPSDKEQTLQLFITNDNGENGEFKLSINSILSEYATIKNSYTISSDEKIKRVTITFKPLPNILLKEPKVSLEKIETNKEGINAKATATLTLPITYLNKITGATIALKENPPIKKITAKTQKTTKTQKEKSAKPENNPSKTIKKEYPTKLTTLTDKSQTKTHAKNYIYIASLLVLTLLLSLFTKRYAFHNNTRTATVEEYIKAERLRGSSDTEILQALMEAGWKFTDIIKKFR